ncbi:MAG: restriction endonuclease subunit S [Clostridia bacterium]|nr:restriction endonuclease subunit S [Clostridia bacterium]
MNLYERELGEFVESITDTTKINKSEVILINTSDIENGKVLNHEYVSNKNLKGQFKKRFKKNDILYSEIRPKNKRFAYINFDSDDYIASTKLMVLRNKGNIDNDYLYQILKSDNVINYLQHVAETRSGTFPQITFNELSKTKIMIPDLKNQRKIAYILNILDRKIDLNIHTNNNLQVA